MPIRKTPEETASRRLEVKDFMESIGPYSVPVKVLAEKHSVTVKIIYNDIQYWIKKIDMKKIDFEGRKLIMSLRKNLAITESIKVDDKSSKAERIKAIQASNQTAEILTKLMENYGFKEKIAEKYEVGGEGAIFNLIEKSVEEIKDAKLKREPAQPGDKPKAS